MGFFEQYCRSFPFPRISNFMFNYRCLGPLPGLTDPSDDATHAVRIMRSTYYIDGTGHSNGKKPYTRNTHGTGTEQPHLKVNLVFNSDLSLNGRYRLSGIYMLIPMPIMYYTWCQVLGRSLPVYKIRKRRRTRSKRHDRRVKYTSSVKSGPRVKMEIPKAIAHPI